MNKLMILFGAMVLSSQAAADNCDFLIAQFNQTPVAVFDPLPGGNNSEPAMAARMEALELFAKGYEQCNSGQPVQGAEKIQQAISLLLTL